MVISNYEKKKIKKLEDKNIVCETLYYNNNQKHNKNNIYVRSTDGKMLEKIVNKAIKEKRYFINNECVYREDKFNSHLLYTINNYNDEEEIIKCSNCGNKGKAKDLIDGCPYCHADFNFGINNINVSKTEKVDKIVEDNFWIVYFRILVILFILCIMLFSISIVFGIICFIYFSIDAFIILFIWQFTSLSDKRNKDTNYMALSDKDYRNIWKSDKNENQFYNDLNKAIIDYMCNKVNLIDFDIIDNNGLEFLTSDMIVVNLVIRELYYDTNFFKVTKVLKIGMKYILGKKIDGNYSIITCPHCGASINVSESKCEYCNNKIYYNRCWTIDNVEELSN